MKVYCRNCQIHFIDGFKETLEAPCNFWGDMGLSNVHVSFKRKIWDWIFAMPSDEIAIRYGINLAVSISGNPVREEDKIENKIPGYVNMNDNERKLAQKQYFARQSSLDDKLKNTPKRRAD